MRSRNLLLVALFLTSNSAWAIDGFSLGDPIDSPKASAPMLQDTTKTSSAIPDYSLCYKWMISASEIGWAAVAQDYEDCIRKALSEFENANRIGDYSDPWPNLEQTSG